MSNPDAVRFKEISKQVQENKLTPEQARAQIEGIDFLKFNIIDINSVQRADWLTDDQSVSILKAWIHQQDQVLLNLRAQLIFTPEISKDRLAELAEAVKLPSMECDFVVEDIIYKLATHGGQLATPEMPINTEAPEKGLIGFDCMKSSAKEKFPITNLFDFRKDTYYSSPPRDNAYVLIMLPPFLKANLTSYKLGAPPKIKDQTLQGGIKSWVLIGSNDLEEIKGSNAFTIDSVSSDLFLEKPETVHVYNVKPSNYFRYFKLVMTGPNHVNNKSIILSSFDISGKLIISRD